eukprot:g2965.t1
MEYEFVRSNLDKLTCLFDANFLEDKLSSLSIFWATPHQKPWKELEWMEGLPQDLTCPPGLTDLEYLAKLTPKVIELALQVYQQIRPVCTDRTCRKMIAGKYEYQWKHHLRSKKSRSYPAVYYFKLMFQWVHEQWHIFEMELSRYERLCRELRYDSDMPVALQVEVTSEIVAAYLYDPRYYLTGIWAKVFSIFAHVFCQHFSEDDLPPEARKFMEAGFERFINLVRYYNVLSTRRLAPLQDRIAKIPPPPSMALYIKGDDSSDQCDAQGEPSTLDISHKACQADIPTRT